MRELYDPVRTAALFKEARDIIAALDGEIRDLAVQIRSASLGDLQYGGDHELVAGPCAIGVTITKTALRNKPFWKFWR